MSCIRLKDPGDFRPWTLAQFVLAAALAFATPAVWAQTPGSWLNSQGCWCGYQTGIPRAYRVVGQYSALADRQAAASMIEYWNRHANLFTVEAASSTGFGAAGNGVNEVNLFMQSADSQTVYGFAMEPTLYGRGVMLPDASFGSFNECKDFSATGCAAFTETDVVINGGFQTGWTKDWFNDGGGDGPALIQTTTLHEVGHTLGLHHVFTLPAFGDSFSCMNYMHDDSGKFVTRMDARTLRAEYPTRAQNLSDIAIYPFVYGNSQNGEQYATLTKTSVQAGESVMLNHWLIQNVGSQILNDIKVTFYLFPAGSRAYPAPTDVSIGTAEFTSAPLDVEEDISGTPLRIPRSVPSGNYNLGAIVTAGGQEDAPWVAGTPNNNRFIVGHGTRTVIAVANPAPPGVYLESLNVQDTCPSGAGSGDGALDPGEEARLTITVRNSGSAAATGAWGTLSSSTAGVTMTSADVVFGTVPAGGTVTAALPGAFRLAPAAACDTHVALALHTLADQGAWDDTFTVDAGRLIGGGPIVEVLHESFEAWPPPGWTLAHDYGAGWVSSATYANCGGGHPNDTGGTGLFADADSSCNGGYGEDATMITPAFSLADPLVATAGLQFKTSFRCYYDGFYTYFDHAYVGVTTDNGANWTIILHWNYTGYDEPRTEILDLSRWVGEPSVRLAFRYLTPRAAWDWNWHIDDVVAGYTTKQCTSTPCTSAPCTVGCSAVVPRTGQPGVSLAFQASASPSGCSAQPSFDWDFGDGTSHQAGPGASHAYAAPGHYTWSVTSSADGQTCRRAGIVTVASQPVLPGDCDVNGTVTIGELQKAVNMYLGTQTVGCGADCTGNGTVSIGEVQKVVNAYLGTATGC